MSTDLELLEQAAKAAGLTGFTFINGNGAVYLPKPGIMQPYQQWNPLADDGDAMRLMARLNITVSYRENVNGAWVVAEHEGIDFCPESLDGPHEYDATRRAIVRAAAQIGKTNQPGEAG